MKYFLERAQKEKVPIWQFNFCDLWQFIGILQGAKKFKKPLILGTSEGEAKTLGVEIAATLQKIAQKRLKVPVFLNLDHAKDFDLIKEAIRAGYQMIHFDGSSLPLKENIKITKKLVKMCHKKGILVEGELGEIPKADSPKESKKLLTDPEEAKIFAQKTGIDLLAVSIGNVHGILKKMPPLDLARLYVIKKEIEKARLKVFLVLHGGSGIKREEIKKAVREGVVKININTELRIAWKKGLIEDLKSKEVAPYKVVQRAIENVAKVVEDKMKIFL